MTDTPDDRSDPLDNIDFEEFSLDEPGSYDQPADYGGYAPPPPALVTCPSCGAGQPATNRHCEQCGARLSQSALPVAPRPLGGMTAGTRALAVLGSVIGVVIVLAVLLNLFSGGDDTTAGDTVAGDDGGSDVSESTSTTATAPLQQIDPIDVRCSSELNDTTLACGNLIDRSAEPWNDAGLQGVGATMTFTFAEPVALTQIHFINLEDDVRFQRNYRIRGVEIQADDLPGLPIIDEIANDNARPHVVTVNTLGTAQVIISVNSTHPSEPVDGKAFEELAVQEIEFWGRVVGSPAVPSDDAGTDDGGSDSGDTDS